MSIKITLEYDIYIIKMDTNHSITFDAIHKIIQQIKNVDKKNLAQCQYNNGFEYNLESDAYELNWC